MTAGPGPSAHVLDLFAVPDAVRRVPGGGGHSVVAGDLVLSPGRDDAGAAWLYPVLARLSVRLDERPGRSRRDLRVALPVPARDGSWVVDGWGATRHEPGTTACTDLDVLLATGHLLHAETAVAVPVQPPALRLRNDLGSDRWAVAERLAFGPADHLPDGVRDDPAGRTAGRLLASLGGHPLGPDQLVHGDLAGNVLLDAAGAPFVIDFSPAWRPALWAAGVTVVDSVVRGHADPAVVAGWADGPRRDALLRAAVFRLLSDPEPDVAHYLAMLAPALGSGG